MLSEDLESQSLATTEAFLSVTSHLNEVATQQASPPATTTKTATRFCGYYQDCMEMFAPKDKVAEYLQNHASWFSRCAEPMKVEPLGENSYALAIGRFGSFGYEIEPKIGLELLCPENGIYRIRTIPIPEDRTFGYEVDYRASLQLVEQISSPQAGMEPVQVTRVEWELNLIVDIYFPKFIERLPKSLIQSTGDRLLNQIVRQVSRRLTRKVQQDFHQSQKLPFPNNFQHKS
jgi:hypothetical protein